MGLSPSFVLLKAPIAPVSAPGALCERGQSETIQLIYRLSVGWEFADAPDKG